MQEAGVLNGVEKMPWTNLWIRFVQPYGSCLRMDTWKKFVEVCKINEKLFEGAIIRSMRRLEEFMKQMCLAKVIGDSVLEDKFDKQYQQ